MSLTVLSQREVGGGLSSHLAYGAWNEAEDVLVSAGGADLVLLKRRNGRHRGGHGVGTSLHARRLAGRAVRRLAGRSATLPAFKSALSPAAVDGGHVLFLAYGPWDLPVVEQLKELRRSDTVVSMWMPEVWPSALTDERLKFEGYDMLDHLFVGVEEAIEPFKAIAPSVDVRYVPPATDVVVFGARDVDSRRDIDVLGIGRRQPDQHGAIMDWADRNNKLYIYDTIRGPAADWLEHRRNLADWYRHSKIALCNYAKHDMSSLVGDLRVLPTRLFEGLAAGAILVGMAPSETAQRGLLGVSVVESTDHLDVTALLDKFGSDDACREMRIRNAAMAGRGHDWAHRWRVILAEIGIPEPPGITERIDALAQRADEFEAML